MQKALELDPNNASAHYALARLLLRQGDRAGAAAEFTRYGKLQQEMKTQRMENVALEIGSGLKEMNAGNLTGAVADFRKAVQAAPQSADAHNHLGVALANLGQTDAAMAEFQKAIELQPKTAAAYNNVADLMAKQGDLDAAIDQLHKAITLKADLAQAHYNLGLLLLKKGEKRQSREEFTKAAALGYAPQIQESAQKK